MTDFAAPSLPTSKSDPESFQRQILAWYDSHRRDLPWRGDPDPYHILVSEVMLQQTGVERVRLKYQEFLDRFPTLRQLAAAPTGEVLRAWQGLGYNRRALNLKRAAEAACRIHDGALPPTVAELEKFPGIGRYTARAVACFAFNVQTEVVDTNIRRVLSAFAGRDLTERETDELARALLPAGRAADWNQALMDYGATVYRAKRKKSAQPTEPFATTNRFWRGRIVDTLRDHCDMSLRDLLDALPYPNRDEERVRALVRALHEEGMVQYKTSTDSISLPD